MELGSWFHFLVWDERWERRHRVFGEKSWVSCAVENGEVWRREQALPIQEAPGSERCSPCPTQGFSQRQMSHRGWRWSPSRLKWQRGDHLPSSSLLLQVCFLLVSRFPFILTLLPPLPMASKASTSGFFPFSIPESLSILLTQDMWFFFPLMKTSCLILLTQVIPFLPASHEKHPTPEAKGVSDCPRAQVHSTILPNGASQLGKTFHQVHPMSLLSTLTDDRSVSFLSSLWTCFLRHSSLLFKVTPSHISPRHSTIAVTVRSSLSTANTLKMLRMYHLVSQHSKFKSSVHNSLGTICWAVKCVPCVIDISNLGHPGRRHG